MSQKKPFSKTFPRCVKEKDSWIGQMRQKQ